LETNIILNKEQIYTEAFKRGFFDFITVSQNGKHLKQEAALKKLTDDETFDLLYGGAAGGGKSFLGCCWLLFMCLSCPGTTWFIGREELKRLKDSTLLTFFKVCKEFGITSYSFNGQMNYIQFFNGSRISLLDLKFLPSDPLYERYGSVEYTGGWIEEAGEVHFGAFDTLKTRVGRNLNDKYNLGRGKIFLTANPKKNWIYTYYYKPSVNNELESGRVFIQAKIVDNPFKESGYEANLNAITDPITKARLRDGNWEYDDDPTALCSYDNIISIFKNNHVQKGVKYLTADIARFGSDKARIAVWEGWVLVEQVSFAISAQTLIQDTILALRVKYSIPAKNCIADEDGLGGGIVDNCAILGFVNNSTPILPKETKENPLNKIKAENYANLQAQCIYGLAEKINENEFYVECELSQSDKEEIALELSWMKTYKTDDERKLRVLPKEKVKENIGHSPDWRDLFMMRYYFELNIPREVDFGW